MKTLILSPRFHPVVSGYEYYLLKLAHSLIRERSEIQVFTTDAYDIEHYWLPGYRCIKTSWESSGGISIRRFPVLHHKWRRRAFRLLGLLPFTSLRALYRRPAFLLSGLEPALLRETFDQIHVGPLPHTCLMYRGIRTARRKKARVIVTPATHLGPENSTVVRQYYVRDYQIDVLNFCDAILISTRAEYEWLARLGVKENKLKPYTLGIDIDRVTGGDAARFRRKHDIWEPIVLFLGMQAFEKGTCHLVEAMQQLWTRGLNARLVLAGPSLGQFRQFLEVQPAFVRQRVLELGTISDLEKADVLAAAEIVALPSRVESFGLAYLEAWANKKPVIGAHTPATAEVISAGENGLLVEFGDVQGLARALERLLTNPELRQEMGEKGWEKTVSQHSWEQAWKTLAPHFGIVPSVNPAVKEERVTP